MSKPISFGFGKPKASNTTTPTPSLNTTKTSLSFPTKITLSKTTPRPALISAAALRGDDDDEQDEQEPKHEALTGFSSSGAILSKPIEEKKELVISNAGNADWARAVRQKSGLPVEVRARREGRDVVMIEKDEVSTASGLQLAPKTDGELQSTSDTSTTVNGNGNYGVEQSKPMTADEEALQALLDGDEARARNTAIITAGEDVLFGQLENKDNFQNFVESHPDSSTLEEYAAMPVEEFGLAMLRGMGKKRKARGEIIQLQSDEVDTKKPKRQEFLGIGAKPAPNLDGVELGAWGKADMRKNNRGAGFFTPLMVRDTKTGETITEEELERRKKVGDKSEDRRGVGSGDGKDRDSKNGSSRHGRAKENGAGSSRHDTRDHRDREGEGVDSRSYSRRHRSRSRSKERRHRADDNYVSSSSHKERDRDRDRDRPRDKNRDYEPDDRRHRHRDKR